ncbi:uncharacterized protein MONOS_6281 [Monocercomonoides exilis]|uniref:uncharacterized protein n=1 Tax=Monocercomonoides exilis TaxID=2049356 RepID=UPI00355A06A7|nr:hypothetical protein MONOS_6281 [Monocercomonoides exilis]|eukprot:MONOS_6281.1-p1 / transcript=MONOS_6281.1 / gene=MONOS_6281 / organism=Monocercomonoides_exilis_PA203 / gene_product=unspecified product / transcript_product=unspecified product / location=Mono_scaffold00195:76732-78797(-) / protein_length=492 / sequence_SO=supercontig / SO=protein_coding / is_pseudo=false
MTFSFEKPKKSSAKKRRTAEQPREAESGFGGSKFLELFTKEEISELSRVALRRQFPLSLLVCMHILAFKHKRNSPISCSMFFPLLSYLSHGSFEIGLMCDAEELTSFLLNEMSEELLVALDGGCRVRFLRENRRKIICVLKEEGERRWYMSSNILLLASEPDKKKEQTEHEARITSSYDGKGKCKEEKMDGGQFEVELLGKEEELMKGVKMKRTSEEWKSMLRSKEFEREQIAELINWGRCSSKGKGKGKGKSKGSVLLQKWEKLKRSRSCLQASERAAEIPSEPVRFVGLVGLVEKKEGDSCFVQSSTKRKRGMRLSSFLPPKYLWPPTLAKWSDKSEAIWKGQSKGKQCFREAADELQKATVCSEAPHENCADNSQHSQDCPVDSDFNTSASSDSLHNPTFSSSTHSISSSSTFQKWKRRGEKKRNLETEKLKEVKEEEENIFTENECHGEGKKYHELFNRYDNFSQALEAEEEEIGKDTTVFEIEEAI